MIVPDDKDRPVYVISVAAELVDMHPQTLRLYERKGLIRPQRTSGKTRRYSERDVEYLREIRRLTQELGVNLAGVEEIMKLRFELDGVQQQLENEIYHLEDALRATFDAQTREALALEHASAPLDEADRPVYVISVAAELVDMHPQTLRLYERKGLIRPQRTSGKTRRYSIRDVDHLREVRRLTQELGVNLAGVEEVMRLRFQLDDAQDRLEAEAGRLQREINTKFAAMQALPAPSKTSSKAAGKPKKKPA